MTKRASWVISLLFAAAVQAAPGDYASIRAKLNQIEAGSLRPGTRVVLTPQELNAYVEHEAPKGVRNPRVQVSSPGIATGTALIDFNKVQRAQGYEPGWLMSKLLEGERPVSVTVQVRSASGHATVDVQKVEISGITIDGKTLDFLIQNFLLPMYPDAAVGRPFELGNRIEKLDVQPAAVGVLIGR